jgi:hypothetical protein
LLLQLQELRLFQKTQTIQRFLMSQKNHLNPRIRMFQKIHSILRCLKTHLNQKYRMFPKTRQFQKFPKIRSGPGDYKYWEAPKDQK